MILSLHGWREIVLLTVAAVSLTLLCWASGVWWASIVVAMLWVALLAFFRDPPRRLPSDQEPGTMISPADGVVSAVEEVASHATVDGAAVIIRIFLSVLDVHVNRMPCGVTVIDRTYRPGAFLDARSEESAKVNESILLALECDTGPKIGVRQVSGALARRIICTAESGDHFEQGQRFGLIKFGSTTELILPASARPTVAVGDRVVGGKSVVAILHS
jgi:phosphatidylserine decarboxylase